ncbi:MAG: EAL domain-containing protein [Ruminococcus sp.]|nr:EAL domain-containing protein [Ruminococcus sp.]
MLGLIYAFILSVLAAVVLFFYKAIKKKKQNSFFRSIQNLLLLAVFTILLYSVAIISPAEIISRFFYSSYYISCAVLMRFMLRYVIKLTDSEKQIPALHYFIKFFMWLDVILMISNMFFKNVFSCTAEKLSTGATVFYMTDRTPLIAVHRAYVYSMFILIFLTLVYNIVRLPGLYRKKLYITLGLCVLALVSNISFIVFRTPVDFSIASYALVAAGIYYFSVIYIPFDLVEQMLSSVVRNIDGIISCYDIRGKCLYISERALKTLDSEDTAALMEKYLNDSTEIHGLSDYKELSWKESVFIKGKLRYYVMNYKALYDERNKYIGCFIIFHDETDELLAYKEERHRLTHDKLTDLYNKEYFYTRVKELLKNVGNNEYYMICTDIKDFKLVNDVFGVEKGDELLVSISNSMRFFDRGQAKAVYGRISGDRFAVCVPKERFKEKLFIKAIRQLGEVSENRAYHVYIHVGVYLISDTSLEVSVMCDRAFMAINAIKDSYTEIIAYYDEKLRDARIHEKKITSEFDKAIRNGQFRMFLQPQIDVSGEIVGAEALVRWFHPTQGVIPPLDFISIFEKSGLIGTLDHHVWELACKQLKKWKDEGREKYYISVNISPKDFYFMDIYDIFTGLIEKYDISPSKLKLEITETAIMTDLKNSLDLIDKLRSYGFEIEIDDFGSGYSSLSMLKEINVDVLKVDMGFLEKTDNLEKSRAILHTIISLSKQLGMQVITEGVETEEQVEFLREAGCDAFQGYYFDRPMNVEDFEKKYLSYS